MDQPQLRIEVKLQWYEADAGKTSKNCTSSSVVHHRVQPPNEKKHEEESWYGNRNVRPLSIKLSSGPHSIEIFTYKLADIMIIDAEGLPELPTVDPEDQLHLSLRQSVRDKVKRLFDEEALAALKITLGIYTMSIINKPLFTTDDLPDTNIMRPMTHSMKFIIGQYFKDMSVQRGEPSFLKESFKMFYCDLGEYLAKCQSTKTYLSTSLYLFWTTHCVLAYLPLGTHGHALAKTYAEVFFLNYVGMVLAVEDRVSRLRDEKSALGK